MAFLDNSGDIILDAVLTDTGRLRLAKGDGSFNITKFALGDDEINYELYDKNHPSGSAYFDVEILQSPVLEAFTNNTSVLKSKLLSVSRTNLLYLPEIRNNATDGIAENSSNGIVSVAVDQSTVDALKDSSGNLLAGIIDSAELDRNTTDKKGMSPLNLLGIPWQEMTVVYMIVESVIRSQEPSPEFPAFDMNRIKINLPEIYSLLTDGKDFESFQKNNTIYLAIAVKNNDIETIKKAIEDGVDLDKKDKDGNTLLIGASLSENSEMVKTLIDGGANLVLEQVRVSGWNRIGI